VARVVPYFLLGETSSSRGFSFLVSKIGLGKFIDGRSWRIQQDPDRRGEL